MTHELKAKSNSNCNQLSIYSDPATRALRRKHKELMSLAFNEPTEGGHTVRKRDLMSYTYPECNWVR